MESTLCDSEIETIMLGVCYLIKVFMAFCRKMVVTIHSYIITGFVIKSWQLVFPLH